MKEYTDRFNVGLVPCTAVHAHEPTVYLSRPDVHVIVRTKAATTVPYIFGVLWA